MYVPNAPVHLHAPCQSSEARHHGKTMEPERVELLSLSVSQDYIRGYHRFLFAFS